MKKLFLRKVSAVATALLIVSGNVPIQPLSQLFEKTAVTAAAEDETSEYWADKKASALVESEDHETIYISTAEELALFAYNVNNGVQNDNVPYSDRTVVLQDDIDLSGANWTPIGTESAPFTGEFDGSGCTITGLRVIDQDCSGLFGVASNAVLSSVVISDATISSSAFLADPYGSGTKTGSGFNFCGVLAGTVIGESLITDCSVSGLVSGKQYTGGLVGQCGEGAGTVTICDSTADGEVYASSSYTGGFVGYTADSPVILRCCTESFVASERGKDNTGGFVGNHGGGFIKDAYAESSVDSNAFDGGHYGNNTGGFAGSVSSSARIAAAWCYSYVSSDGYKALLFRG